MGRALAVVAAAVCCVALTARSGYAAEHSAGDEVSDFTHFLTFVARAPLTAASRTRLAAATQSSLRANPTDVYKFDTFVRAFLTRVANSEMWERARRRENRRRIEETERKSDDPIRRILDGTDPVVVVEPTQKWMITEGTLAAWQQAYTWAAKLLSVPPPRSDFIAAQRTYLRERYASLPRSQQMQIAHLESNFPMTVIAVSYMSRAGRTKFIGRVRPQALDPVQFPMRLVGEMASMEHLGFYDIFLRNMVMNTIILNSQANTNASLRVLHSHQPIAAPIHPMPMPP